MRIELVNISKIYGSLWANHNISLVIEPGSIHGILGENGAGKSTLMKIMAGFIKSSRGRIMVDDILFRFKTPSEIAKLGIGMLYQEPLDFPSLTVLDNYMLGQASGFSAKRKYYRLAFEKLADTINFSIDPDRILGSLTIGERQQLEIIRLLSLGIKVLILDEPTTGISEIQKEKLFNALRVLRDEGRSIVLVSHKMEDVEALCDRITVLRQGKFAGEMKRPFNTLKLLEMMFGTPPGTPSRKGARRGNIIFEMKGVSASGGRIGLSKCHVEIREGEIIGLAGLEGSGQGVFLRVAAGLQDPAKGTIAVKGRKRTTADYNLSRREGIVFLPADRLGEGLIAGLTIAEHFALQQPSRSFFIRWQAAIRRAEERINAFNIKGRPGLAVEKLSGGNQQRLLLSFLPDAPMLLLLENPTRGLDMASVNWVWHHLQYYSSNKTSIVFSSSELDEILMVASRVIVFYNGRVVRNLRTEETDIDDLGRAIAGK